MTNPYRPLDVHSIVATLDNDFQGEYATISSERTEVTEEAVEQLVRLSGLPEVELRATLVTFATEREAIPAASYADPLVKRVADEPRFGRIYSFALRNAWQDEALHTNFLLECVPKNAAERRVDKKAAKQGRRAGRWAARVYHDPGPFTKLAHRAVVQYAIRRRNAPIKAIRSIRPMKTASEYFCTSVDFEYAAALGWRVIASAELPKRWIDHGNGERNRRFWRTQRTEPSDLARVAQRIAETEIRHAKTFWHLAQPSNRRTLIAKLKSVDDAFVAPEFRIAHLPKPPYMFWRSDPATDPATVIKQLLRAVRQSDGRGHVARRVVLAISDCSPRTAQTVSECFRDSRWWQYRSIGAPSGVTVEGADGASEAFEFEAGCAKARWPLAWAGADVRVSIADVGTSLRPDLSLGAIGRLVEVFPEQLRTPLEDTPDPQLYGLMWFLERYPPHLSIIFDDDGALYVDDQEELVAFDNAVTKHQGLRRSVALEEAIRWFGPLVPAADGGAVS